MGHFLPSVSSLSAKNFYYELFSYISGTQLKNDTSDITKLQDILQVKSDPSYSVICSSGRPVTKDLVRTALVGSEITRFSKNKTKSKSKNRNTQSKLNFTWTMNNLWHSYVPCDSWDIENYSLFIQNSNFIRHWVFYLAAPGWVSTLSLQSLYVLSTLPRNYFD